jgi:hypothetical protein
MDCRQARRSLLHVKSEESHKLRLLLGHRCTLKRTLIDIENEVRELHDRYGTPGFLAAYNVGLGRYERHLATDRRLPDETHV